MKLFAFTLDLEADYAGCVNNYGIFKSLDKIGEVLSALDSLDVKTTVFTVCNLFKSCPEVIKLFEKYNCEFEAHSYSHDFNHPDSKYEIENAKKSYFDYFKKNPIGYRAPRGKISPSGIKLLEKNGFLYDTSVFPSYFPNPFRYLFNNRKIHYYNDSKILEIPLTVITPLRLTLSISYIKLLGIDFFIKSSKLFTLPDIICFDSHLHDFIHIDSSFNKLPIYWRFIYGRNKLRGLDYCIKYLKHIHDQGYKFCYLSEIYNLHKDNLI